MHKHHRTFKGILTVGELKKIIEMGQLSDETQIVIHHDPESLSEYFNVSRIDLPDEDSYFALTLTTADTFDARQF